MTCVQRILGDPSFARAPEQVILSPGFRLVFDQPSRSSACGLSISITQCSTDPSGAVASR